MNRKDNISRYIPGITKASVIVIMLLFAACEKKADWELHSEELNTIVVEGILTNEFKQQEIKLSYPVMEMNELPEAVTDANVTVSFGGHEIEFIESNETPGLYLSNVEFRTVENIDYFLDITLDTATYSAETYMVGIQAFSNPYFHYNSETGLFKLIMSNYQYHPFEQSMYEVIIDWQHIPGYEHPDSVSHAKMLFYVLNTIDVSYIVSPQDTEEVHFPGGSTAIISKYSLNEDYAAYLRALLIETNWQGSIFEGARGNLPTNISNGGLGFFSACAIVRDTLTVQ